MKIKQIVFLLVIIPFLGFGQIDIESNFYTEPISFKVTKNLKKDFNVDALFETDDSEELQKAIDCISKKGGGKLIIPKGNYSFTDIVLKSNVHIEIDSDAVIRPFKRSNSKNYFIFLLSSDTKEPIENVSVVGLDGQFIIDLSHTEHKRVRCFSIRNIHNFKLSNFKIIDNYTLFASLEFLPLEIKKEDKLFSSKNGLIKNIDGLGIADYGYGLVQVRTGKNILFQNLSGIGGTTLRLEGHLKELRAIGGKDNMENIIGRNIRCKKGNAALMLSPHYIYNGLVDIRDITAIGCGFAVRIDSGFANKDEKKIGLKPGYFSPESVVSNVKATFASSEAQIKPKHYKFMPCNLRSEIHKTPITPFPHGDSYNGPSIAAVVYNPNYKINFSKKEVVLAEGFQDNQVVVTSKGTIKDSDCP
ncbi:hypothetical protein Q4566_12250 [Tamlana sp. 2_MG-2023]|uniref:hypothetical protein n=1 Tax=unclassified Tamlana TaxID=2614803 RepID=UPI0026E121D8|nr:MULTISPECIES: hypothetical protein [unclassified Tamlana]MDO6760976.1 hypothetical protein [Tamlana sp. 2_MG-2023]MDO6791232.1 hypothetical protein [Tamlana sp. 1_MG-2023]